MVLFIVHISYLGKVQHFRINKMEIVSCILFFVSYLKWKHVSCIWFLCLLMNLPSLFTASLQCCRSHQPHEEDAPRPLRTGPEAGQHPKHQGDRRVLPRENLQTSPPRQAWPYRGRRQRESTWHRSHVVAQESHWTEEPLPPSESHAESLWPPPCTHHRWAGQACLPVGARQPQRVCPNLITHGD